MNTFLYNPITDTLVHRDASNTTFTVPIRISDPVSIEYKHVYLALGTPTDTKSSNHHLLSRDLLFSAFVKNRVSKDRSLETVVYYDKCYQTGTDKTTQNKYQRFYDIGPFDQSEYGCSVIMYTPGYEGSTITVTTKFFEIRKTLVDVIKSATSLLQTVSTTATTASSIPILNIASPLINSAIGIGGALLTEAVDEKHQISEPATIEFKFGDNREPFVSGLYVQFLTDELVNVSELGLQGYVLVNKNTSKLYREHSYFILQIDTSQRNDLRDFDFTSSCSEQLVPIASLLHGVSGCATDNSTLLQQIVDVKRDAYDLLLYKSIQIALSHNDMALAKALYQQLQASNPERAAWLVDHCGFASQLVTRSS